jgi:hypothetical protein|tara:strand:+ start:723 stop:872 length:150 start_codon:yes stop_codon:yes gene_type:complete
MEGAGRYDSEIKVLSLDQQTIKELELRIKRLKMKKFAILKNQNERPDKL